jgi:hypothetical protein
MPRVTVGREIVRVRVIGRMVVRVMRVVPGFAVVVVRRFGMIGRPGGNVARGLDTSGQADGHLGGAEAAPVHLGHLDRDAVEAEPVGKTGQPLHRSARVHQGPEEHVSAHAGGGVDHGEPVVTHRLQISHDAPDEAIVIPQTVSGPSGGA